MKANQRPATPPERSLEQMRMHYALQVVNEMYARCEKAKDSQLWKEYQARSKQLPAQIMHSGLSQALAFTRSKMEKEEAHRCTYEQLRDWLCGRGRAASVVDADWMFVFPGGGDILEEVLAAHSMEKYLQATQEALALQHFIKRFASAYKLD